MDEDTKYPLTAEQFDSLTRLVESAAHVAVAQALQNNREMYASSVRGYTDDKEAARRALVGDI